MTVTATTLMLGAGLLACAPRLDWREINPAGSDIAASFPCKPDLGERGKMGLARCEAAGLEFSLSWAEPGDPGQIGPALAAMPQAVAAKLGQPLPEPVPLLVTGMTPRPGSAQYRFAQPQSVTRLAVFSYGPRVYQAMLRARQDDPQAWEVFVAGLHFGLSSTRAVPG